MERHNTAGWKPRTYTLNNKVTANRKDRKHGRSKTIHLYTQDELDNGPKNHQNIFHIVGSNG